jgi:hypothetical protein
VPNRTLLASSINVVHTGSQKYVAISIVARWRQAFGSIDAIRHNADKGSGSNGPTGPKRSPYWTGTQSARRCGRALFFKPDRRFECLMAAWAAECVS